MDMSIPPKPCFEIPMNCSICGSWLTDVTKDGIGIASSHYNGTDVCDSCIVEHCLATNCLDCNWGHYPDCQYLSMKKNYQTE